MRSDKEVSESGGLPTLPGNLCDGMVICHSKSKVGLNFAVNGRSSDVEKYNLHVTEFKLKASLIRGKKMAVLWTSWSGLGSDLVSPELNFFNISTL